PRRGHPRRPRPRGDGPRAQRDGRQPRGTRARRAGRRGPGRHAHPAPARRGRRMTTPHGIPAMPNAHSHAFQLDLRGIGERPAPEAHATDDFWTWRTEMFRLAGALDPDAMRAVADRVYREMAAAGYGAVGEFHYVHHRPDGTAYDQPNVMAFAVAEAAVAAGLEIVLLPAA